MQQIKFYRTPTLPTEDTTGSYEVGSLYFYHNDSDGYNELYLCKASTDSGYEFENYSGNTFWESSWEDTPGGGSGSGGSGSEGDSPVIPDSGTITNVGDGKITVNLVSIDAAGVETTDEWSFSVNQSEDFTSTLSLETLGGVSQYELYNYLERYLPLIGGIMTGMIDCSNSNSGLTFGDNTINIDDTGSISVNTTNQHPFNVNTNLSVTGNVNATAFYETSDARKKDIKSDLPLDKCYDLIDKCQTVIYSLKDQTQEQVGMIAQEIEEFFPEVVATDVDGFKSLAYDRLVVICFKVLKDIIKRLEKLES